MWEHVHEGDLSLSSESQTSLPVSLFHPPPRACVVGKIGRIQSSSIARLWRVRVKAEMDAAPAGAAVAAEKPVSCPGSSKEGPC